MILVSLPLLTSARPGRTRAIGPSGRREVIDAVAIALLIYAGQKILDVASDQWKKRADRDTDSDAKKSKKKKRNAKS